MVWGAFEWQMKSSFTTRAILPKTPKVPFPEKAGLFLQLFDRLILFRHICQNTSNHVSVSQMFHLFLFTIFQVDPDNSQKTPRRYEEWIARGNVGGMSDNELFIKERFVGPVHGHIHHCCIIVALVRRSHLHIPLLLPSPQRVNHKLGRSHLQLQKVTQPAFPCSKTSAHKKVTKLLTWIFRSAERIRNLSTFFGSERFENIRAEWYEQFHQQWRACYTVNGYIIQSTAALRLIHLSAVYSLDCRWIFSPRIVTYTTNSGRYGKTTDTVTLTSSHPSTRLRWRNASKLIKKSINRLLYWSMTKSHLHNLILDI